MVNLRARALGRVTKPSLHEIDPGGADASSAQTGVQQVHREGERHDVPVYERELLGPGMRLDGYAIVAQYDATTVVLPGHRATVDRWQNLLIEPLE